MNTLVQKFAISWIITWLLIGVCHWNWSRIYSLTEIEIINSMIWTLHIINILLFSKLLLEGILLAYYLCVIIKNILNSIHLLSSDRRLTVEILSVLLWVQVCIIVIKCSLTLKVLVDDSEGLIVRLSVFRIFLVHCDLSLKLFTLPIRKILGSVILQRLSNHSHCVFICLLLFIQLYLLLFHHSPRWKFP